MFILSIYGWEICVSFWIVLEDNELMNFDLGKCYVNIFW